MRSTLRRRLRLWRRLGNARPRGLRLPGRARVRLPAACVGITLAFPAAAAASPAWAPPREISDSRSAPLGLAATAGLAPTGNAVVLWHAAGGIQAVVRGSHRSFG